MPYKPYATNPIDSYGTYSLIPQMSDRSSPKYNNNNCKK